MNPVACPPPHWSDGWPRAIHDFATTWMFGGSKVASALFFALVIYAELRGHWRWVRDSLRWWRYLPSRLAEKLRSMAPKVRTVERPLGAGEALIRTKSMLIDGTPVTAHYETDKVTGELRVKYWVPDAPPKLTTREAKKLMAESHPTNDEAMN